VATSSYLIKEVQFPNGYLSASDKLHYVLVEAMKRDGVPIDTGVVRLGSLSEDLQLALFFLGWTSDFNEIVHGLNYALTDLDDLGRYHPVTKGEPRQRFEIMNRLYFHEFYRSREVFGRAMASLKRAGYMSVDDLRGMREIFNEAFSHTIQLRNQFVHGSVNWVGRDYLDLVFLEANKMRGYALQDRQTGALMSEQEILRRLCAEACAMLGTEGQRLSEVMQRIIDFWANKTTELQPAKPLHWR